MEYIIASSILVIVMWQVIKKAGYRHPEISLLMFVPFVNLGLLFWIAFSTWPVHRVLVNLLDPVESSNLFDEDRKEKSDGSLLKKSEVNF